MQIELKQYTFLVFVGLLVFFLLFIIFFVPETKNRTFEDIASTFTSAKTSKVDFAVSRAESKAATAH